MNKLLNRFAWILSLSFGFIITFVIIGSGSYNFDSEEILMSAFWGIGAGLIIKKVIFSKAFIEDRVTHFAEVLAESYFEKTTNKVVGGSGVGEEISTEVDIEEAVVEKDIYEDFSPQVIQYNSKETEVLEEDFEKVQSVAYENIEKQEKVEYVPSTFDIYMEKTGEYIKDFFATNTLAKIGGILVFLAVVYFLKGVASQFWDVIGPVGRLIIGFIIGFSTLGVGVFLHKRGDENEGLILIGLSILINYAVILSGRYLIGENTLSGGDGFLTEGITFMLLILNTVFGVVTSLVYQSRTLLIFSFVFAYLNPFIIGASSTGSPNTLVFYSLIISFGGLILSNIFSGKKFIKSEIGSTNVSTLLIIAFVFGNILILVAPFGDSFGWITKMLSSVILSIASIYTYYQNSTNNNLKGIVGLFITSYMFVILLLVAGGLVNNVLGAFSSSLLYTIILLSCFALTIRFISNIDSPTGKSETLSGTISLLQILLFAPIILFTVLIISGAVFSATLLFVITLLAYLTGFIVLQRILSSMFSYMYFIVLAVFIFFTDLSFIDGNRTYDLSVFLTTIGTSFVFLFSSYYFSTKKGLTNLYSIGTIGGILTLAPVIVSSYYKMYGGVGEQQTEYYLQIQAVEETLILISAVAIGIFALANWVLPFLNKHLLNNEKNIGNLIIGSLAGVLFIAFEIWSFGNEFFAGIAQGFAFAGLAVIYFIQSFFIVQKMGALSTGEQSKESKKSLKNVFYTYAGVSLSLFSLAIAFVFSDYPEIISTVWLFEATILYYFYSQNSEWKLLLAGNILFAIGIFNLGFLLDVVKSGDYKFLVSFSVIAASLILNIKFIDKIKSAAGKSIHYILHIIGIGILAWLLSIIIVSTGHGWSSFGIVIFVSIIGFFYSLLQTNTLKWFFVSILVGFSFFHIGGVEYIFYNLDNDEKNYLKVLQYIVSGLVISNYFIWKKTSQLKASSPLEEKAHNSLTKTILIIVSIYAFIISNIYILDIFEELLGHFALTMYWGILASILLFYGIANDVIKFRTVGLYFIILTSVKIFGYDVWFGLDNAASRIGAFMGLGIAFITISTFYTRKYGNNILGELNLENLKDTQSKQFSTKEQTPTKNQTDKLSRDINTNKTNEKTEKKVDTNPKGKVEKKVTEKQKVETASSKIDTSFMEKLEKVKVDDIKVVRFFPKKSEKFTIRAGNLIKLSQLVTKQLGKTSFKPGELNKIYDYVIANYKSDLSRREFDKLRTTMKDFIDEGGEVEIIKK